MQQFVQVGRSVYHTRLRAVLAFMYVDIYCIVCLPFKCISRCIITHTTQPSMRNIPHLKSVKPKRVTEFIETLLQIEPLTVNLLLHIEVYVASLSDTSCFIHSFTCPGTTCTLTHHALHPTHHRVRDAWAAVDRRA